MKTTIRFHTAKKSNVNHQQAFWWILTCNLLSNNLSMLKKIKRVMLHQPLGQLQKVLEAQATPSLPTTTFKNTR